MIFIFEDCLNVPTKSKKQKNFGKNFVFDILKVTDEQGGSGARSESRFGTRLYGSAEPDPYQNVTDQQHCIVPTPFL
jgi:hypothetical protein